MEEKYLVMVTDDNHNKYYHMIPNGSNFSVEYGRIGSSMRTDTYPSYKFESKYYEKIRKGYQDKTGLYLSEHKTTSLKSIHDAKIREFIDKLLKFSNDSVFNNYTVNVNAVTQSQIDEAQKVLNRLFDMLKRQFTIGEFNKSLIELYSILPRKMSKVKNHLINDFDLREIKNVLVKEQDLLDSLSSSMNVANSTNDNNDQNVLDILGIEVEHCTDKEISEIQSHMGQISNKFSQAFKVKHHKQSAEFTKFEKTKRDLLWHGTRNENVISILQKSLQIRPSGVVITGAMFGNAVYFANKAIKAMGYTSTKGSIWANGKDSVGYLFVFDVALGNQKHIYKHDSSCYNLNESKLKSEGFDSVYAHGGIDLKNDEFMIYNSSQCRIKYIIEIK